MSSRAEAAIIFHIELKTLAADEFFTVANYTTFVDFARRPVSNAEFSSTAKMRNGSGLALLLPHSVVTQYQMNMR